MTTTKEDQIHAEFNAWVFNPNSEGYPLPNPHSAMASWKACAESYENKLAEKDEQITALQMGWNECIDKLSEAVAAWEAEKLEPLRREVAMLHDAIAGTITLNVDNYYDSSLLHKVCDAHEEKRLYIQHQPDFAQSCSG